jgi:hypothetical protein
VAKIGALNPGAVIQYIDELIVPLEKTVMKKPPTKEGVAASGPEVKNMNHYRLAKCESIQNNSES